MVISTKLTALIYGKESVQIVKGEENKNLSIFELIRRKMPIRIIPSQILFLIKK